MYICDASTKLNAPLSTFLVSNKELHLAYAFLFYVSLVRLLCDDTKGILKKNEKKSHVLG